MDNTLVLSRVNGLSHIKGWEGQRGGDARRHQEQHIGHAPYSTFTRTYKQNFHTANALNDLLKRSVQALKGCGGGINLQPDSPSWWYGSYAALHIQQPAVVLQEEPFDVAGLIVELVNERLDGNWITKDYDLFVHIISLQRM